MMKTIQYFLLLMFLIVNFTYCSAKCCGTFGPWGHCCDHATCNIFCCNCDGDCTADCKRKIVRSTFSQENGTEKFATTDTNNDNFIDFDEALKYAFEHGGNATELKSDQTWFKKLMKIVMD